MGTLGGKRILLVDDDQHLVITLGDYLTSKGFDVTRALNGREALRALETLKPDLILMDIMMPGMDGGDVAQAIRSNPRLARVPIVYLTAAVSESEVRAHDGLIGGEPFIAKPVDPKELMEQINRYLAG